MKKITFAATVFVAVLTASFANAKDGGAYLGADFIGAHARAKIHDRK